MSNQLNGRYVHPQLRKYVYCVLIKFGAVGLMRDIGVHDVV
jgi:hypothetical protein